MTLKAVAATLVHKLATSPLGESTLKQLRMPSPQFVEQVTFPKLRLPSVKKPFFPSLKSFRPRPRGRF